MAAQLKKPSSESKSIETNDSTSNVQEEICQRAYELYEHRGTQDGHDLEDWLQSQAEVMVSWLSVKWRRGVLR